MVTVVNLGSGNLRSLRNALGALGLASRECEAPPEGGGGTYLLPGVGAFGHAAEALARSGWRDFLRREVRAGARLVGICLGMQLLFEESEESPGAEGLGLVPGAVSRLSTDRGKVPNIGWARLRFEGGAPARPALEWAYFVHSYAARPTDPGTVVAWAEHGGREFPAAVRSGSAVGVQFHPEKSRRAGLAYLGSLLGGAP